MADTPTSPATELVEALRGVLCQVADPAHVLRTVLEQAVAQTGAERGLFVEVAGEGALSYQVLHGFQPAQLEGDAGRYSRTLFARVIASRTDVLLASIADDPALAPIESVRELRTAAVLCAPIVVDARVVGLVYLEHRREGHFTEAHRERLQALVQVAGPVLQALQVGRAVLGERDALRAAETRLRSETEESRRQLASDWSFRRFVGRSAVVRELESLVRRAATSPYPVLLTGETGTGKGIVARVLHYASPRAAQPFVTVFGPTLERGMVEAELFGHRKGAFTGAAADRAGKVPAAEGGTLFLDEIGELPLDVQPKLLRLLQEGTYERLGDATERRADVRVIAATNRDLEHEVEQGRFRRDLFERLHFLPVHVPSLRERIEDLPLLLRHALDQTEAGRWIELTPAAEQALMACDTAWPGNVRQLEQLAARLSLRTASGPVGADELLQLLQRRPAAAGATPSAPAGDLDEGLPALVEEAERRWLSEALRRHPDLTRAELAARLKISESALYKKLRGYGLGA